jgi:diguanylate cyclase (GGDEF)-like protein
MSAGTTPPLRTLRQVLARVHFRVTLFAVGMAGITVLLTGFATIIGYAHENLRLVANAASYAVAPAVTFDDSEGARASVAPLTAGHGVSRISVIDARDHVLVTVTKDVRAGSPIDSWLAPVIFPQPTVIPIMHQDRAIGRVLVYGDVQAIVSYIRTGLAGALACLLITALATHLLARHLQRGVIGPLRAIADVAHRVSRERRFDLRAPPASIAEIDTLGQDFNALLAELDDWHHHLRREHETLSHRALHDPLTGLPNRVQFEERLAAAVTDASLNEGSFAVLYFDGDGFKAINDALGHAAGDAVLKEAGARLAASLGVNDCGARLGGDEFAALLAAPNGEDAVERVVTSLDTRMRQPIVLPDGSSRILSFSVGSALFPRDGADATTLIQAADAAMYAAKQRKHAQGGTR